MNVNTPTKSEQIPEKLMSEIESGKNSVTRIKSEIDRLSRLQKQIEMEIFTKEKNLEYLTEKESVLTERVKKEREEVDELIKEKRQETLNINNLRKEQDKINEKNIKEREYLNQINSDLEDEKISLNEISENLKNKDKDLINLQTSLQKKKEIIEEALRQL